MRGENAASSTGIERSGCWNGAVIHVESSPSAVQLYSLCLQTGRETVQVKPLWVHQHRNTGIPDFVTGELKACQIIEIMTGENSPAVCAYNEFGEPLPCKWDLERGWPKPKVTEYLGIARELKRELYSIYLRIKISK